MQLTQMVGRIVDLVSLAFFFAVLFMQSKTLRNKQNFLVAILLCISINYVDLFFNTASIPLFFISYFLFFKVDNTSFLTKSNYIIKSLLMYIVLINTCVVFAIKTMSPLNINAYPYSLYFIGIYILYLSLSSLIIWSLHNYFITKVIFKLDKYLDEWTRNAFIYLSGVLLILLISALHIARAFNANINMVFTTLIIFAFAVFIFVLSLIFIVAVHIGELETKHEQERIRDNKEYVAELEDNYESLRHYQHDYKNILLGIELLVNDHDFLGAKGYLANALNDSQNSSYIMNKNTHYILDSTVKGMVLNKSFIAKQAGVSFTVLINKNLGSPALKPIVLTRLLGILFDNAIEAAKHSAEKTIEVAMNTKPDYLEIIIRNSFDDTNKPDLSKIFTAGYSTKGSKRGIGLATVKDITTHYDNVLVNASIKDSNFIFSLIISNSTK
ncbi:sensor histidine kinase [Lactiplantibacillus herbarum]|uniref:sensor histidine kinase n=1 Tax=Lactiplantibacillus herbarum TaxID=1670446 RepID=UPI00064E4C14|nr:GHKL domain-containing protein [Lactiplantibacillus herbarum]